jgi:SPOR domain
VPYFILDLLQQVPSVYVKGLGRFDAIFHPAVMDLAQSQVKPPYIEPDFRADGESKGEILSRYIHYATGVGVEKAREAIEQFVLEVNTHIAGDESYTIDKFGTFSKSSLGNIRFTPDWDAFNLSFSGLEVLDLKIQEEAGKTYPMDIPPPVTPRFETPPLPEPIEIVKESEKESIQITESAKTYEPVREISEIDHNTSKLWWMILSSALILIAVLCAYLAWDIISNRNKLNELKQIYPDSTFLRPGEITMPSDTQRIIVENIPLQEVPLQKDSTPVQEVREDISEPCFIVVGAFTDPSNVAKMEERLKSIGYTSEAIKGKTLTRVAIRTSCDPANMQKILNEARSSINPEAWIY